MPGVGLLALGPLKVGYVERCGVLCPVTEVGSGEHGPLPHDVGAVLSGLVNAREEPQRVVLNERRGVGGVHVGEEGVALGRVLMLHDVAPLLLEALHLAGRDGYDGAVAGGEILAERLRLLRERLQVARGLVLVAARAIEVVHQHIAAAVVEGEHARSLNARLLVGVGVDKLEVFLPGSGEFLGRSHLYAVLYLLALGVLDVALVEQVVHAVALNDVVVDASVFGREQHLRLALEAREVVVGVGVIGDEALAAVARALQGEVNHVFLGLAVVDGLRRPHPVGVGEVLVSLLQHNLAMAPMHQVGRSHHHNAGVVLPSVLHGVHVGCHDVIVTVSAPQDMGVANAATGGDGVAAYDGAVVVERIPILGVLADGKAQMFLQFALACALKIGKEVTRILVFRCGCRRWCRPK